MSASGEVYSKYKRGPRTDPCGTPRSKERREDRQLLTLTNCVLDVKYDFSQESTVPLIPNRVDNLDNKMEWSTLYYRKVHNKTISKSLVAYNLLCHIIDMYITKR